MVTQRTKGLYRLFLLSQIVIVAALFWLAVWIMVTFYSPGAQLTWRRYSIYCGVLVIGMVFESLSREGSKNYFFQHELLRQHRRTCPLSYGDERRIHLPTFLFQLCPVALRSAAFLAPLSPVLSRAP